MKKFEDHKANPGKLPPPHEKYCVLKCSNCNCKPTPKIAALQKINEDLLRTFIANSQ